MRGGTCLTERDVCMNLFQSTLPMRGGTNWIPRLPPTPRFQSTLPMRGGTIGAVVSMIITDISIHPPHAGRDVMDSIGNCEADVFQSTLPMRGGT